MDFLTLPVDDAAGCILTHSLGTGASIIKKGTVLTQAVLMELQSAGIERVPVARLSPDDIPENAAADQLAHAICGQHVSLRAPFTGRVNLHATKAGLLLLDEAALFQFNACDESITIATLSPFSVVAPEDMVATIKIIPFAVAGPLVQQVESRTRPAVSVAPFQAKRVAVISTLLPHLKNSTVIKTLRALETRLAPSQSRIVADERVPHDTASIVAALKNPSVALADVVIIFGASAVTDRRDVVPAAMAGAGGVVRHVGMPVDPGNLLVLGDLDGRPVIGAPGCARSPRENGFDWVLNRLLCDLPVSACDIMRMGVGGLLKEIGTRPQPREGSVA